MAATRPLDGPRLEPRGRAASALVVLLHGYGANGDDLIALGDGWRQWLPDAAFVAPNAPQTIPGMYGGLQWFALTLRDPSEYWRGVEAARPALDRFLDAELARYRLAPEPARAGGLQPGHHDGPARRACGAPRRPPASSPTRACSPDPSTSARRRRARRSCSSTARPTT